MTVDENGRDPLWAGADHIKQLLELLGERSRPGEPLTAFASRIGRKTATPGEDL